MVRRPRVSNEDIVVLDGLADYIDVMLTEWSEREWRHTRTDDETPRDHERGLLCRQYGPGGDWDDEAVRIAVSFCSLQLSVASQHIDALSCLLRERLVFFTPPILARSIMEIGGYVAWLLDPSVTIRQRAARSYLAQLDDEVRARGVARGVDHPSAGRRSEGVAALRRRITTKLFYPSEVESGKSGKLSLVGQEFPSLSGSLTFLQKVTGSESWNARSAYAMMSNASHPTPHVSGELVTIHQGSVRFEMEDALYPYRVTHIAVTAFLDLWQLYAAYLGYSQDAAIAMKRRLRQVPRPNTR